MERFRYRVASISKPDLERIASELAITIEGERDNLRLGSAGPEYTIHATPSAVEDIVKTYNVRARVCAARGIT
jgi:hypothetical protein